MGSTYCRSLIVDRRGSGLNDGARLTGPKRETARNTGLKRDVSAFTFSARAATLQTSQAVVDGSDCERIAKETEEQETRPHQEGRQCG
jgi:hypothetical protein